MTVREYLNIVTFSGATFYKGGEIMISSDGPRKMNIATGYGGLELYLDVIFEDQYGGIPIIPSDEKELLNIARAGFGKPNDTLKLENITTKQYKVIFNNNPEDFVNITRTQCFYIIGVMMNKPDYEIELTPKVT